MRVTKEAKASTHRRILDAARELFTAKGWDQTSTREIALKAKIAAGTLFNYFPTKEALAAAFIAQTLDEARAEFHQRRRGDETLEEDLFSFIWSGLRHLAPWRTFLAPALETLFSPLARTSAVPEAEALRVSHLEEFHALLAAHGMEEPPSFITLHLYWTLYLGVLGCWVRDESPKQEQTLAVLDQSLRLFVATLRKSPAAGEDLRMEVSHDG